MREWVNSPSNRKPNRDKYNIYQDGLKIYTTIDSRMQIFAETATKEHMSNLQTEFFVQNTPERNPTTPFLKLKPKQVTALLNSSMKRSERWRKMKYDLQKQDKEIVESFKTPASMKIFSWTAKNNEIDTVMTPLDSMRYYKSLLRTRRRKLQDPTSKISCAKIGSNATAPPKRNKCCQPKSLGHVV